MEGVHLLWQVDRTPGRSAQGRANTLLSECSDAGSSHSDVDSCFSRWSVPIPLIPGVQMAGMAEKDHAQGEI